MNKAIFAIVLVFLTAFIFRFWNLAKLPVSLSMDEVTSGYGAYSVFKTGRDENGKLLPLAFKGIGDYKPPVDVYLKIPFIALLGLNEFSVRVPTALLGAFSSVFLFFY